MQLLLAVPGLRKRRLADIHRLLETFALLRRVDWGFGAPHASLEDVGCIAGGRSYPLPVRCHAYNLPSITYQATCVSVIHLGVPFFDHLSLIWVFNSSRNFTHSCAILSEIFKSDKGHRDVVKGSSEQSIFQNVFHTEACLLVNIWWLHIFDTVPDALNCLLVLYLIEYTVTYVHIVSYWGYLLAITMKSWSLVILNDFISGIATTTLGLPPRLIILASMSPKVLHTESLPGSTL